MEYVVNIDPLTYGIDGLRGVLTGVTNFGITFDLIVLGCVTAALLGIGSYLFSRIQA